MNNDNEKSDSRKDSRRLILEALSEGPKSVNELVEITGLSQPNVSNHLARLKEENHVRMQPVGKARIYSLINPMIHPALISRGAHYSELQHVPIDWQKRFLRALVDGDEELCREIVDDCLHSQINQENIYTELFERTLYDVGEWYSLGAIDEATEHRATAITERLMARVAQSFPMVGNSGYTVVLGAVEENWHSVGLRMIADVLTKEGWKTHYLGASVPTESFVNIVELSRPDLVLITCSLEDHLPQTERLLKALNGLKRHSNRHNFLIAVGGGILRGDYPKALQMGADFTAADLHQFMQELKKRFSNRITRK